MDTPITVQKINDNRGVELHPVGNRHELLLMRNGFQWTGVPVDDELLDMLQEAILEYKAARTEAAVAEQCNQLANPEGALPYSFDLLYDIKTPEGLSTEISHLSARLAGLTSLCRQVGRPVDSYVQGAFQASGFPRFGKPAPLTLEQIQAVLTATFADDSVQPDDVTLVRAIEARHGIK